jgi:hypothetical protein
LADFPV